MEIYPETACSVKTVLVPIGYAQKKLCAWQEATCKNIECAFGVFQCKFQILCHPLEKWDDHASIMVCILFHNMMVQECVNSKNDPFDNFCAMYDLDDIHDNECNNDKNGVLSSHVNVASADGDNSINDNAAEQVHHIEAEVIKKLTGMSNCYPPTDNINHTAAMAASLQC